MDITPQKSVIKFSSVTGDMLDVAKGLLRDLGVKQMSKKYSNRDVLYGILQAALSVGQGSSGLAKSELDWAQFFKDCRVIVKDPTIGRQLMKESLETVEAFTVLIGSVAHDGAMVIPLEDYPGVSLFKDLPQ